MQEHNELAQTNNSQTDTAPLQPMNFTDILDGMFTVYRNHYHLLLKIAAVYLVLEFAIDMVSAYFVTGATPSMTLVTAGFSLMATSVLSFLVTGGLIYASARVYLGREITFEAAFQQAFRRFWSYLGSGLLYLLAAGGLCITVIGSPFGIYFGIRWSFYSLAVLVEETRAWNSLGRSTELVKGSWWRVLGILMAIYLISFMITIILYIAIEFILSLAGIIEIEETSGLLDALLRLFVPSPDEAGWFTYAIQRFVALLIATVTMPIAIIGTTLLYFDLRIRKEALDIEMQVTD